VTASSLLLVGRPDVIRSAVPRPGRNGRCWFDPAGGTPARCLAFAAPVRVDLGLWVLRAGAVDAPAVAVPSRPATAGHSLTVRDSCAGNVCGSWRPDPGHDGGRVRPARPGSRRPPPSRPNSLGRVEPSPDSTGGRMSTASGPGPVLPLPASGVPPGHTNPADAMTDRGPAEAPPLRRARNYPVMTVMGNSTAIQPGRRSRSVEPTDRGRGPEGD
jgi:hypothetical protein